MAKSYEAAGVNLEAGYEVVRRIKSHVASTKRVGSMGNIGTHNIKNSDSKKCCQRRVDCTKV